ncbi:MAG: hypothetical protein ACK53U_01680 [Alphaproteobacteria bacterium]
MFGWSTDKSSKIVDELQIRASILRGDLERFVKRHGHYIRADIIHSACIVSALIECLVRSRLSSAKAQKILPKVHDEAFAYLFATVLFDGIKDAESGKVYSYLVPKLINYYYENLSLIIKADYSKTNAPALYQSVGHAEAISLFVLTELQSKPTKETSQEVEMLYQPWAHIIFDWRKGVDEYLRTAG